ncbi:MAG TPA: M56 family metallopeptidase [Chryseolinea sp.]|nr:M56 family metallopeptidase [Chryseolinea sp.]
MAKLIMYLLESSVVLTLFYLLYFSILRKETFFSFNRFFLLVIVSVSLLLPLLDFDFKYANIDVVAGPLDKISSFRTASYETIVLWEFENSALTSANTTALATKPIVFASDCIKVLFIALLLLYAIGIVVCLSRLGWTLRWILKMINKHPQQKFGSVKVIKVPNPTAPFSFLKYVFIHDAMVDAPDFDQILAHEKTHVQQKHSIDLIYVQLLAAFFWFNPVFWQLIKSLKTTHEYIADKQMINSGYSLVEYQTLLLKQLISNNSFGLVHNFNLSFIKKRITMMKNKKSGWSGKLKVAATIAGAVIFSLAVMQCNSKFEEPGSLNSESTSANKLTDAVELPVLPKTGYKFTGDSTDALTFTVVGDRLSINGKRYEVSDIVSMIEKGGLPSIKGFIVMRVDKNQPMGLVRDVQMELRKADRRKILYVGQTITGERVDSPLMLPPAPGDEPLPTAMDLIASGKLDLLKIDLGENAGSVNQQRVYDFVQSHIQKQSSGYVVSASFENEDTYNDYLVNLIYIKEGFDQIYQERAQKMFGKDFYETEKEEYLAVRKGIPTAISVAEPHKD